jgi:hypothetical protein
MKVSAQRQSLTLIWVKLRSFDLRVAPDADTFEQASSTPTICRLSDSHRHQLSAIAPGRALPPSATLVPEGSSLVNLRNSA